MEVPSEPASFERQSESKYCTLFMQPDTANTAGPLPSTETIVVMPEQGIIALVSRIGEAQQRLWASRLSALLPGERVVLFDDLCESERGAAEIAVVANPDPAVLAQLPNLVWVHSLWAGVERMVAELPGFRPPVVRLIDPELARTMAEAVLAWTLYLFRDMPAYAQQQRERRWHQLEYRRPEQVTVGILGLGALGSAAALRLIDAGFNVIGWSRSPRTVPGADCRHGAGALGQVLAASQFLVILTPLTSETRGLMNAARLAELPEGAKLINFARGPIVDTANLIEALDSGHLAHAVLDVFDEEPLPVDSVLWNHPGVTVLPHIAAPTDPETAAQIVAGNIRCWRRTGELPPAVDLGRGY